MTAGVDPAAALTGPHRPAPSPASGRPFPAGRTRWPHPAVGTGGWGRRLGPAGAPLAGGWPRPASAGSDVLTQGKYAAGYLRLFARRYLWLFHFYIGAINLIYSQR